MLRFLILATAALGLASLIDCKTAALAAEFKAQTVDIPIANDTGEDIFFYICGKHGCKRFDVKKDGIITVTFYDDGNERTLSAFDAAGKKVLCLFKFVPGNYCIVLEKSQTELKKVDANSRKATETYKGDPL